MIIPIVSAITREVVSTVPHDHKEAALALGATRWEMIKIAVLPYSRSGITGAAMLGLGRAMGETIAATIVIGNAPVIGKSLFDQGKPAALDFGIGYKWRAGQSNLMLATRRGNQAALDR